MTLSPHSEREASAVDRALKAQYERANAAEARVRKLEEALALLLGRKTYGIGTPLVLLETPLKQDELDRVKALVEHLL